MKHAGRNRTRKHRNPNPTPISFVGVGAQTSANGPASLTPALPAGVVANDLILVMVGHRASTGDETISTPAGYTNVIDGFNNATWLHVDRKVAVGGDANPTVNIANLVAGETAVAQCAVFRGCDTTTPIDITGTAAGGASGSQTVIGPISGFTPVTRGAFVIFCGAQRATNSDPIATLSGDGLTWNEIAEVIQDATVGSGYCMVWDYAQNLDKRTVTAKTFSATPSGTPSWRGQGFALRPATAAPTVQTYTLTVTIDGSGTGTGLVTGLGIDSSAGDLTQELVEGTDWYIDATPAAGSVLTSITGDGTGSPHRTGDLTGNAAVTVKFDLAPAGGSSSVPGTGAVLKEDLNTDSSPITLWRQVADSWYEGGTWASDDPQIQRLTASPDTHSPVGGSGAPTHYWRLKTLETQINGSQSWPRGTVTVDDTTEFPTVSPTSTASVRGQISFTYTGKTPTTLTGCSNWDGGTATSGTLNDNDYVVSQSQTDAAVPNSSTRCQIVNNSSTNTFYKYDTGTERITYASFRSFVSDESLLLQIKELSAHGLPPILSINDIGSNTWELKQNYNRNPVILSTFSVPASTWVRLALAVKFSNDPAVGYVHLYADLTGSGSLTSVSGQQFCRTAYDGTLAGSSSTLSIGPYHKMDKRAHTIDVQSVQVCEFTHP